MEFGREGLGKLGFPIRDGDGLLKAAEGILDEDLVFSLAEEKANRGLVIGVAEQIVHGSAVEVDLSGIAGFEGAGLEFYDDMAPELEMVEKEVEVEILVANLEMHLPTDKGETGSQLEKRFIRKDGTVVHTLFAGGRGPIGDRPPELFYINILDISHRKKAEKKLQDTLMSLPLPVACGSNDQQPAITLVNKAFTETFGYTREDIPTVQAWLEAAYPDPAYRAEILAGWEAGMARGRSEEGAIGMNEVRIRCKDGSVRDAIFNATLTEDGPIVALQDISKRKQLEEELATAREREKQTEQEMRASLETKLKTSLNAAAVAHEINQPLSRILLRASLDLEKESGTGKKTLQALIKDAERVVTTIDKMKVLLRNVETVQQPVELARIISSSLHQIKQPLRRTRVKITRTIQETGCIVLGDEVQLQMIVTNLLRNAIEAISGADSPKREISIALASRESTIELLIGDSGPGWPGGTLDEMLLKSSKRDGSGIGLYVVKTAMENHRGRIEIGRSPLGGAEFRMLFMTEPPL